jgi:hypothetical protein
VERGGGEGRRGGGGGRDEGRVVLEGCVQRGVFRGCIRGRTEGCIKRVVLRGLC